MHKLVLKNLLFKLTFKITIEIDTIPGSYYSVAQKILFHLHLKLRRFLNRLVLATLNAITLCHTCSASERSPQSKDVPRNLICPHSSVNGVVVVVLVGGVHSFWHRSFFFCGNIFLGLRCHGILVKVEYFLFYEHLLCGRDPIECRSSRPVA